jgi:uncharacterized membrane protein
VDLYPLLKYLHVLLAIGAVGLNVSYAVWLQRASRAPQHLGHVLATLQFLDDRLANPAYALLLATGFGLVWLGPWRLDTFWIAAALVLYGVLVVLGLGGYSRILRQQVRTLQAEGPATPAYRRLARRATLVGSASLVVALAIVYLMVVKPSP